MSDMLILYIYRIFWAAFLGGILAWGFRRSWNAEHGKTSSWMEDREDTVVWMDPIVLPVMLTLFPLLYMCVYGISDGLDYCLCLLVDVLVFVSLYFSGLLLLLPFLRRRYTARTCAVLWLVPVFLFYQPHMVYLLMPGPPPAVLYVPGTVLRVLIALWGAGFLVLFGMKIVSHMWFSWSLRRNSHPVEEPVILESWEKMRSELDVHIPVDLRYSSLIGTPLTIGMRKKKKATYLPERSYTAEEAEMVFSHELHHVQRRDTHTRCFLEFCKALGWFHPLVWAAVRKAQDDLELSCDEIVLEKYDADRRKKYAELLLVTAGESRGFTTCLSSSARTLRYRMRAIVTTGRRKLGVGLLFSVMVLSVLAMGKVSIATDRAPAAEVLGICEDSLSRAWLMSDEMEDGKVRDIEGLTEYLSRLQVERLIHTYEILPEPAGYEMSGITAASTVFRIYDGYLEISYPEKRGTVLCTIRGSVDWEKIRTFV